MANIQKFRAHESLAIESAGDWQVQTAVTADSDDDFGFNETISFFQDAKDRDLSTGEDKTSTND